MLRFLLIFLCFICYDLVALGQTVKRFPICLPDNYEIVNTGPCVKAVRTIQFKKIPNPFYACRGPESFELRDQSCACELEEYVPKLSGKHRVIQFTPSNSECASNADVLTQLTSELTASSWVRDVCTTADIGVEFLKCNPQTGMKQAVFYSVRPCYSVSDLPSPMDVPCKITCAAGDYLNQLNVQCSKCPSGTFSIPGTVYGPRWDQDTWPDNFHNVDRGTDVVKWMMVDGVLKSNHAYNNSRSVLKFMATITALPAYLVLEYQILADSSSNISIDVSINHYFIFSDSRKMEEYNSVKLILSNELELCEWKIHSGDKYACIVFADGANFSELAEDSEYTGVIHMSPSCDKQDYTDKKPSGVKSYFVIMDFSNLQKSAFTSCSVQDLISTAASSTGVSGIFLGTNVVFDLSNVTIPVPVAYIHPEELSRLSYISDVFSFSLVELENDFVETHVEVHLTASANAYRRAQYLENGVQLRRIEVHGTQGAATQCHQCPPGYSSQAGSGTCVMCPENTYSDRYGMAWPCQPCPKLTVSTAGSSRCISLKPCGREDYLASLGKCILREGAYGDVNYRQTLEYKLISPATCDTKALSEYKPNPPRQVLCSSCSDGLVRRAGACVPCGAGEVAVTKDNVCKACPRGTYANRFLNYEDFSDLEGEIPSKWKVECKTCLGPGWRFVPSATEDSKTKHADASPRIYLAAGYGFSHDSVSHLEIPFEVSGPGWVYFSYQVQHPEGHDADASSFYGTFTILGEVAGYASESTELTENNNGGMISMQLPLNQEGEGILKWTWGVHSIGTQLSHPRSILLIHSLKIHGEVNGGASICEDCPSGSECSTGIIEKCPAGTYRSGPEMDRCEVCPDGLVAIHAGSEVCQECPHGTKAALNGQQCYFTSASINLLSNWKHVENHYDLSVLERRLGPYPMGWLQGSSIVINLTNNHSLQGLQDCGADIQPPYVCLRSNAEGLSEITDRRIGESITSLSTQVNPSTTGENIVINVRSQRLCSHNIAMSQSTLITLECEENKSFYSRRPSGDIVATSVNWDGCTAEVTLVSPYFCPFCNTVNCERFHGPCVEGFREVHFGCERVCRESDGAVTAMTRSYHKERCSTLGQLSGHRRLLGSVLLLMFLCLLWLGLVAQYLYVTRRKLLSAMLLLHRDRIPGDLLFSPKPL